MGTCTEFGEIMNKSRQGNRDFTACDENSIMLGCSCTHRWAWVLVCNKFYILYQDQACRYFHKQVKIMFIIVGMPYVIITIKDFLVSTTRSTIKTLVWKTNNWNKH